jgi:hypothetical protein
MAWPGVGNSGSAQANGSAHTLTCTISGISTVAGLGVCFAFAVANAAITWTPPSGWTTVTGFPVQYTFDSGIIFTSVVCFYNESLAAGVTSLAMTATVASADQVQAIVACYGSWRGNGPSPFFEGVATADNTSATAIPSVTSGTENYNGDLGLCFLVAGNDVIPSVPSGTGTWTSITTINDTTNFVAARMCSQIGGQKGTTQTASGSTTSGASPGNVSAIVGFIGLQGIPDVPHGRRLYVPHQRTHNRQDVFPAALVAPAFPFAPVQHKPPPQLAIRGHKAEPPWPQRNPPVPLMRRRGLLPALLRSGVRQRVPKESAAPPPVLRPQRPVRAALPRRQGPALPPSAATQGAPTGLQVRRALLGVALRPRPLPQVLPSTPAVPPPYPPAVTRGRLIMGAVRGPGRLIQVVPPPPQVTSNYPEIIFVDGHPALHVAGVWYTRLD